MGGRLKREWRDGGGGGMSPQDEGPEQVGRLVQREEMIPIVRGARQDRRRWVPGRQSWLAHLCRRWFGEYVSASGGARWWR